MREKVEHLSFYHFRNQSQDFWEADIERGEAITTKYHLSKISDCELKFSSQNKNIKPNEDNSVRKGRFYMQFLKRYLLIQRQECEKLSNK